MSGDRVRPQADRADTAAARRRRTLRILLGSLVVLVVVVVGIAVATGSSPDRTQSRSPLAASESPGPDGDSAAGESAAPVEPDASGTGADEQVAEETVADFLSTTASPIPSNEVAGSEALQRVASGSILNEIEAEGLELEANQWVKSGAPEVVWSKAVADPSSTGRLTVEACLDTSAVAITTRDGDAVDMNTTPRAINIFTVEADGGAMRVIARTFPDDPSC